MHHGNDPEATKIIEAFNNVLKDKAQLGATGEYPEGRLNENDEGEIRFAITSGGGKLVMNFGKPVAWIGMGRSQAVQLIKVLQEHADKL